MQKQNPSQSFDVTTSTTQDSIKFLMDTLTVEQKKEPADQNKELIEFAITTLRDAFKQDYQSNAHKNEAEITEHQRESSRHFILSIFLIGLISAVVMASCAYGFYAKDSKIFKEIITFLVVFAGGIGGGLGISSHVSRQKPKKT